LGIVDSYPRDDFMLKIPEELEMYRNLINFSNDAFLVLDKSGRLKFINKKILEITGYKKEELVGKQFKKLIPTKYLPKYFNFFKRQLRRSRAAITEIEIKTKKRKLIFIELKGLIIKKKKKIIGIQLIARDITERKKLKDSEKKLQDIVFCSADWFWEVDKNGKYTYASGKVKQILGYSPKELIGKSPFELMPKEEAKKIKQIFKKIVSEKKPIVDLENWNITKNGKTVCLLTNGIPILDEKGNLLGYRGIDKDITKRKNTEENAKKYLNIVGNIIVALNSKGKIVLLNKKGYEILGYKEGELIGKDWFKTCLPKENRKEVKKVFKKCMNSKAKLIEHYKNPILTKEGKKKIISWHNALLKDKKGNIIGTLSSGEDITKHEKAEKELKERAKELEKFYKFAVGRELKMIELKKKIKKLENELEKIKRVKKC